MKFTQNFTKTKKDAPKDETADNAKLLIRAGFIHKEMAGVYAYLPLGLMVVENIKEIVRQEMNKLGGQELIMTNLQPKELWEKTDRWDDEKVDVWFKTELKNGQQVGLAWSHEEPITEMMKSFISSYRDLPVYVYQFQTKLRNELRAKSGIMRGREFVMKDLYSYTVDEAAHQKFYDEAIEAYLRVFKRVGLGDDTFLTFASGGAFTQFSHEFQTITGNGEDTIYLHRAKKLAVNEEVLTDDVLKQLGIKRQDLEKVTASEVGNIFSFGSAKSEQLGLHYSDENGNQQPVILGSYGIGITRLMGVIAEQFSDDKGLTWPAEVSPARAHIVSLRGGEDQAGKLYEELLQRGVSAIYDDRDESAGVKLSDADLIGVPLRIVCSQNTASADKYEATARRSGDTKMCSLEDLIKELSIST